MGKLGSFGTIIIATLFTSAAQILYKFGINKGSLLNLYLISGILLYVVAAIIVIIAFRQGKVSVLYPVFATSYIWVILLSSYFFHEAVGQIKFLGIAVIIAGVVLIGLDENKIKESGADGY